MILTSPLNIRKVTKMPIQRYKQIPIRFYEAIHNHYENGHWISEKNYMFKSVKSPAELTHQDVAKALDLDFNPDEDCIWWDEINIDDRINDIPEA
jgi:hypothetical protein